MKFVYLAIAIVSEVTGTIALKASAGFSKPIPSLIVAAGYGVAFYSLSLCLDKIGVGIAYAIWSGLGIVLVSVAAAVAYKEIPDRPAVLGIGLIIAGVLVLNLWSKSGSH